MVLSSQVTDTATVLEILVLIFREERVSAFVFKFLFIIKKNPDNPKALHISTLSVGLLGRAQRGHCHMIALKECKLSTLYLITFKSFLLKIILVCGTDSSNSSPLLGVTNAGSVLQM